MNAGLVEMFEYNRWANRTFIAACASLDAATLRARVPGVSGGIGELFTHFVGGEQTFVLRTKGRQHEGELSRMSRFPGFEELGRIAEVASSELVEIARNLEDEALVDLPYQGKTFRFPVRFFLVHAAQHSLEHRTEIKVALGSLGIATPDLDGWNYAAARGYGEEVASNG